MAAIVRGLTLRSCALLWLFTTSSGALPPGYEQELYCPSGHCLRQKADVPAGFTGPRTAFSECAHRADGDLPAHKPLAWGAKYGEEAKRMLTSQGYHTERCAGGVEPDTEQEETEQESVTDLDREEAQHQREPPADEEEAQIPEQNLEAEEPQEEQQQKQPPHRDQEPESSWFQSPGVVVAAVLAAAAMWKMWEGAAVAAPPTEDQKAAMEQARNRRLEKLSAETEAIRATDEWKAREKRAAVEAAGVITPEDRKSAAGMRRPGAGYAALSGKQE